MSKYSSGKNSTILLISALVIALLFAVYYYLVMPKKEEVVTKESSIASFKESAASLTDQIELLENANATTVDVFALRKKVPNHRAVDELLLNIEQMEFVAGIRINTLAFNNYDTLVSSSDLTDPNSVSPTEEQSTDANQSTEADAQTEVNQSTDVNGQTEVNGSTEPNSEVQPVSTISPEQLPPELKMLTLAIAVEAPTYDALLAFIREVEQLERVIRIDLINYSLNGEEASFNEELSSIVSANIQVTTFYYEGEE